MMGVLFKFSAGDMEEFHALIPNLTPIVINIPDLRLLSFNIPENFFIGGIETPYLIEMFSRTLVIGFVGLGFIYPMVSILYCKCGKHKLVRNMHYFFFFDGVLRA